MSRLRRDAEVLRPRNASLSRVEGPRIIDEAELARYRAVAATIDFEAFIRAELNSKVYKRPYKLKHIRGAPSYPVEGLLED